MIFVCIAIVGASQSSGQGSTEFSGPYVNREYGFSVVIPRGMKASGAAPNAPNRGFLLKK